MKYYMYNKDSDIIIWAVRSDKKEKLIYRFYDNKEYTNKNAGWIEVGDSGVFHKPIDEELGYVEITEEEAFLEML